MTPETPAFVRAIHASPKDSLPWLVLADHLEEHGEDRTAHAIRQSIEFHGGTVDHVRPHGYGSQETANEGKLVHKGDGVHAQSAATLILPHPSLERLMEPRRDHKWLHVIVDRVEATHPAIADTLRRALTEPGGVVRRQMVSWSRMANREVEPYISHRAHPDPLHTVIAAHLYRGPYILEAHHPATDEDVEAFKHHANPGQRHMAGIYASAPFPPVTHGPPRIE